MIQTSYFIFQFSQQHKENLNWAQLFSDSKPAFQVLENKPGYIPVYIRFGDQPLADINPILAEAFGEHEVQARNIKSVI